MARARTDDDETEEAEATPTDLALGELLEQLNSSSTRLSAKVRRVLRPGDEGIPGVSTGYVGRLATLNPATLEDDISKLVGGSGGQFALEIYVDGSYQRGLTRTVEIEGRACAKPDPNAKPEAPKTDAAPVPSPELIALRATVARLESASAERERAAAKAEDQRALAAMIAAAVAPLAAKLEHVSAQPAKPLLSPLEELVVARLKREDKAESEGKDPALMALTSKLDAMTAKLEAQEKERAEDRHKAELEKRDAALADLAAEVEEMRDARNAPKPKNEILEALTEVTITTASIDKLLNAGRDPDKPRINYFQEFIDKNGDRIAKALGPKVEQKLDAALASMTSGPATPPPTPGEKQEDAGAFAQWLQAQMPSNFAVCGDSAAIHETLKRWPRSLSRLAAIRDVPALKAFLVAIGFPSVAVESSVTAEFWGLLEPRLNDLRATLDALVKAANKPAPKVSEPRATRNEDAEADDDGEDEENDDGAEEDEDGEDAEGESEGGAEEDGDGETAA